MAATALWQRLMEPQSQLDYSVPCEQTAFILCEYFSSNLLVESSFFAVTLPQTFKLCADTTGLPESAIRFEMIRILSNY